MKIFAAILCFALVAALVVAPNTSLPFRVTCVSVVVAIAAVMLFRHEK